MFEITKIFPRVRDVIVYFTEIVVIRLCTPRWLGSLHYWHCSALLAPWSWLLTNPSICEDFLLLQDYLYEISITTRCKNWRLLQLSGGAIMIIFLVPPDKKWRVPRVGCNDTNVSVSHTLFKFLLIVTSDQWSEQDDGRHCSSPGTHCHHLTPPLPDWSSWGSFSGVIGFVGRSECWWLQLGG